MNKLEKEHLEAIGKPLYEKEYKSDTPTQDFLDDAATSCASITKEYAEKFVEWISIEGHIPNRHYKGQFISTEFLWNLFLNDLNKKA